MTVGLSSTNNANKLLDQILRNGTALSVASGIFIKLHTADPGSAGTTAASGVTTRVAATWSAASAGSSALSNTPSWSMTGTETISHISFWDNLTVGNFLWSAALTVAQPVVNGSTLNLTSCTVAFTPIAA